MQHFILGSSVAQSDPPPMPSPTPFVRTAQATHSTKPEQCGMETSTGSVNTRRSEKPATSRLNKLQGNASVLLLSDMTNLRSHVDRDSYPNVPAFEGHKDRILAEAEQQPHW